MAHYIPSDGLGHFTGALSKKKDQARITTTRRKHIKDPITGETVGLGPKEIYLQNRRDFDEHPLSDNEKRSRSNWGVTCRLAAVIIRDKSHPRYMELYHRWREHVSSTDTPMQFPNFIRHVLSQEG
ncbi:MAG: hypothetical protein II644_02060 [Paludibacteraceae bacterium]|nr:hypothetical protein [Paludibacteraceae bacterium]